MVKSALLSDGMVLQRGKTVKIWGTDAPYSCLRVLFQGKEYNTAADSNGKWCVEISGHETGGPFEMLIRNASGDKLIKDILVGDVWILSGQSNMELNLGRVRDLYEDETKNDYDSNIRTFIIERNPIFSHNRDEQESGKWLSVTPKTVMLFSAAGYFFAKELRKSANVPIGLILNAVGGSPVEAWMCEETLLEIAPHLNEKINKCKSEAYIESIRNDNAAKTEAWYTKLNTIDKGLLEKFYKVDYDDSEWAVAGMPDSFENIDGGSLKDARGSIWLRKEFDIPQELCLENAKLVLGTLVDGDSTYINGVLAGETGYRYPPRRYYIPSGVLKHGKNIIAVRLISTANTYSFIVDKPYKLVLDNGEVLLEGLWKYCTGAVTDKLPDTHTVEYDETGLYKGVLYSLRNYAVRGTVFYQGESNTNAPLSYLKLFKAMIGDFRDLFGADMPFLFVQLANFADFRRDCRTVNWAVLREAQRRSLIVPNTGMAVTIDAGEWNDLHPLNKKDVGIRLALAARRLSYNEDIVFSGPMYYSKECFADRIELLFKHTGTGLIAKGGKLKTFEIRNAYTDFVPALAEISGDKVIVRGVDSPTEVRYAWLDNPEGANLYNAENLPASPFTTEELFFNE